MKVIPIKPADPDAKCFFDLPRELRDMIYEYYFINYRRAVRRAKAKGNTFCERMPGGDEDDEDDEGVISDQSDGANYASQDSDKHSDVGDSDQDGDSDSSSEYRPLGGYRYRPTISGTYTDDPYQVRFSKYRDEIVVNQDQKLHACLPLLTRTSRQLLAETWSLVYDAEHKFIVHLKCSTIRPLFEREGVFRLLSNVCGIDKISEENTTVVIHGGMGGDDLKWWLKKHWFEGLPLFDTNLEIMFQNSPSPTGGKSYGYRKLHPIFQMRAEYEKKCIGIIRYMRLIHEKDNATWKGLVRKMVDRLDKIKRERFLYVRSRRHRRSSPMKTPEPEDHTDLVEAMFNAVEWIIWPGGRQHKIDWQWQAAGLARATFKLVRDEVKELYGSDFETVEERHRQTALPMNEE